MKSKLMNEIGDILVSIPFWLMATALRMVFFWLIVSILIGVARIAVSNFFASILKY